MNDDNPFAIFSNLLCFFDNRLDSHACTDSYASNYNQDAEADDGSCEYEPYFATVWDEINTTMMAIYIESAQLDGAPLDNGDEVGIFDGDACVGVARLDSPIDDTYQIFVPADDLSIPEIDGYTAGNDISFRYWDVSSQMVYSDVDITITSGSSTYQDFATSIVNLSYYIIWGCTDEIACNYNPDAETDDGSCEYLDPSYCSCEMEILDDCGICGGNNGDMDCTGVCFGDTYVDGCGICDSDSSNDNACFGCTDSYALNYDPDATIDDNSCEYPILGDMNNDGMLNVLDIVLMTNMVLEDGYVEYADINSDGFLNILDLVIMINLVLNPE